MAEGIYNIYDGASHFANDDHTYEVQRTNHFEVVINLQKIGLGEYVEHLRLSTKSIGAPKISAEAIELKHGNDTVKVAARPTYEDLTVTVYDTLGRDQLAVLQEWFKRVFDRETKLMGMVSDYKTDATLYMYSPDSTIARKWVLEGVWPRSLGSANEFSYDSADAQNVTFDLSVDRYWEAQV